MTIRISMQRDAYVGWNGRETPAREDVREFADHQAAANWLIYDSYFEEGYTRRLVWEVIDAVPATAPPPSGATPARTYFAGGPVGASSRRERTSGPLDPEIHAALVRSVERGRRSQPDGVLSREEIDAYYAEHPEEVTPEALAASRAAQDVLAVRQQVREDIRADFLNDDGLSPWERR